jgi:hypothetical protein
VCGVGHGALPRALGRVGMQVVQAVQKSACPREPPSGDMETEKGSLRGRSGKASRASGAGGAAMATCCFALAGRAPAWRISSEK